jgi:hypothetical protein
MAIDASLSHNTKNYLASLVDKQRHLARLSPTLKEPFQDDFSKDAFPTQ